jgi:hypothetical protein
MENRRFAPPGGSAKRPFGKKRSFSTTKFEGPNLSALSNRRLQGCSTYGATDPIELLRTTLVVCYEKALNII